MSIFDDVISTLDSNRFKKNNCISFSNILPRFSEYIPGIQKKRYYIVSGSSGAGKSQLTDHLFVFTPLNFMDQEGSDLNVKIIYFSLELDKNTKMTQWMSRRLFDLYGIRTSMNILQSIGKNRLTDDIFMAVRETRDYFEKLEDRVKIIDNVYDVPSIKREIMSYAQNNGKFIESIKKEGDKEVKVFDKYVPNNPDEYVEIILDHYSLLTPSPNIKAAIEELSSFFVKARNGLGYIPIAIQQQTAEKENVDHFKSSKLDPSKDGLSESKLTYNDCDIALGIFSAYRHEIKKYRGYDILQLGDSYRNLSVFKNRFGIPGANVGLYFDGSVVFFKELCKSEHMNMETYKKIESRKTDW